MSYNELDNNMNIINNIQLTENFAWYNRFLTFLNFLRFFPYLFLDLVIFYLRKIIKNLGIEMLFKLNIIRLFLKYLCLYKKFIIILLTIDNYMK